MPVQTSLYRGILRVEAASEPAAGLTVPPTSLAFSTFCRKQGGSHCRLHSVTTKGVYIVIAVAQPGRKSSWSSSLSSR